MKGDDNAFYRHIERQMGHGRLLEPVRQLRERLAGSPRDPHAHGLLAVALSRLGRNRAAEHEARVALTLAPDSPYARFGAGAAKAAGNQWRVAVPHLEHAREKGGGPALLRLLAQAYATTGDAERAEAVLREALATDAADLATAVQLGHHLLATGQVEEAQRLAQQAISLSASADALVLAGRLLLHQGEVEGARDHAIRALELDHTHRGALGLLAATEARRSWLAGLWWRSLSWLGAERSPRWPLLMVVGFVIYRVASAAAQVHAPGWAMAIQVAWLASALCLAVSPLLWNRSVARALGRR